MLIALLPCLSLTREGCIVDDVDWTGPVDGGRHDEKRDLEEDYKYTEDLRYWI